MEAIKLKFQSDFSKAVSSFSTQREAIKEFTAKTGLGRTQFFYYFGKDNIPNRKTIAKIYNFINDGEYEFSELPLSIQEYITNGRNNCFSSSETVTSLDVNEMLYKSRLHREVYLMSISRENYMPSTIALEAKYGTQIHCVIKDLLDCKSIKIIGHHIVSGNRRAIYNKELCHKLIVDNSYENIISNENKDNSYISKRITHIAVTLSKSEILRADEILLEALDKIAQLGNSSNGEKIYSIGIASRTINE